MRFCIVFSMGSRFSGLGSFWVSFGVSWEHLWEPGGTHLDFSWATWRLLGCLGWPLGSFVGPIWASVGWLCAFLEALWRKSGHQLGDSVSLGSDLASFGYLVCESSFLPYLWMPLVEFVGIGQAGLDLGWFTFCMVEYFVEDIFDNLLLKCSWQRCYVCRACIGSELLYFCTRSWFLCSSGIFAYTINQKYQRDLMYVLQSYVVEPASVRSESNSFFSSLLQHAHTSTCTGAFLSIVPFAW